jgi:hypothetical protein
MSRRPLLTVALVAGLLAITAHRLPAPIQEIPESPTPAPSKSIAPSNPKRSAKSKPNVEQNEISAPRTKPHPTSSNRFAGAWVGTLNFSILGNVEVTFIVNATGTVVSERNRLGNATHEAIWDGTAIRFHTGSLDEIECTLTPNPDGQTAVVTANSLFIANPGAAFRKTGNVETEAAPANTTVAPQTKAASKSAGAPPVAKPVPGKPGFVYDPFDPNSGTLYDVRGRTSGTKVKDPSGRFFIVP